MKQCSSCGSDCGGTKQTGCLYGTIGKYAHKAINVGKYWLESGWYTQEDLYELVDRMKLLNKQASDSMQQVEEKNRG